MEELKLEETAADEFADIRPYEGTEFTDALARLLANKNLVTVFRRQAWPAFPEFFAPVVDTLCHWYLKFLVRNVKTSDELHALILERLISLVVKGTITEFTSTGSENLEAGKHYLYMSNHRDIAMDPVVADYMLLKRGFPSFQTAFGDNLLTSREVSDAIRINKAFIVQRGLEPLAQLKSSMTLSRYIRETIQKKDSVWIAQREGRAKDGDDKTNPAIIKMFALCNRQTGLNFTEYINSLNITPIAVSYEFDPCDRLKARETARKMEKSLRNEVYEKRKNEDFISIVLGIQNKKGRVHVAFGKPLYREEWKNAKEVAQAVDDFILTNYKLWPSNYVAYDIMHSTDKYVKKYTKEYRDKFMARFRRLPPTTLPFVLGTYAKPVENAELYTE
ncbi:MAG: 1-acyl-sn-glycerol-3-phosphate acyltransferase [Spirochaetia bacterium]|nr:1-acyl-sn-glycerol-3-phosphate acyltransferase [Spirochaetia bacterium]